MGYVSCMASSSTGWSFTSEWQDDPFVYLHSGATSRRGGLLGDSSGFLLPQQHCLDPPTWKQIATRQIVHGLMQH